MSLGLLLFRLMLLMGGMEEGTLATALERCLLVAVEPAAQSAVLQAPAEGLVVVHAGEDAPLTCGPFRAVKVLPDRLVLEPSPAAVSTAIYQAWLPLATSAGDATPRLLRRYPEGGLQYQSLPAPAPSAAEPGATNRRVVPEQPPP